MKNLATAVIRNGALAPTALVQSCLDRIGALRPFLNAFVALRREEALDEAAARRRGRVAEKRLGPLAELPIGVKVRRAVACTDPSDVSRHPAGSRRAGRIGAGRPTGLQFVGSRLRDDRALPAAYNDRAPEGAA